MIVGLLRTRQAPCAGVKVVREQKRKASEDSGQAVPGLSHLMACLLVSFFTKELRTPSELISWFAAAEIGLHPHVANL